MTEQVTPPYSAAITFDSRLYHRLSWKKFLFTSGYPDSVGALP